VKKIKNIIVFIFTIFFSFGIPKIAYANTCPSFPPSGDQPWQLCNLADIFAIIIQSVTTIAVLLAFIMILIGGFQFLFSGGDQKAVEKARNTLTWALIGIVILILIWFVLLAINEITGVPVMRFYIGNPLG
jgi:ABC-type Fe3+ transport system permease subunit